MIDNVREKSDLEILGFNHKVQYLTSTSNIQLEESKMEMKIKSKIAYPILCVHNLKCFDNLVNLILEILLIHNWGTL